MPLECKSLFFQDHMSPMPLQIEEYLNMIWDQSHQSTLQDDLKEFTKIERDKVRFQIPPIRKPLYDWEIPIKKNLETLVVIELHINMYGIQ